VIRRFASEAASARLVVPAEQAKSPRSAGSLKLALAVVVVDMLVAWAFDSLERARSLIVIGHIEYATRLAVALALVRAGGRAHPGPFRRPPGQRVHVPRAWWLKAAALAAGALLVGAILLVLGLRPPAPHDRVGAVFSASSKVLALCTITLVSAPLVEEILYRAILLPPLLARVPVALAIAIDALIFMALHAGPYGQWLASIGPFVGGLLFATVFWARRSLWTAVLAHIIANALLMAANFLHVHLFRAHPTWFR
jgi:membrane protease YdiL (CAAX protease family)